MLFALSCGGGSSSSGSGDYILQPGSLTTTTFNTSFNVTYSSGRSGTYAVIYKGTINGTPYIGISIDTDGIPTDSSGFNMKLFFNYSSLPSGNLVLDKDVNGLQVSVKDGATPYSALGVDDNIELNFSGPDSNNIVTIKGVAGNDFLTVGTTDLYIDQTNGIKAYYYNTAQ